MTRFSLTRFAPSPTGFLHEGHLTSALAVWGFARVTGAKIVVRLEDHDQSRCRPEFSSSIREDLDWLGFLSGEAGQQVRSFETQSSRPQRYLDAVKLLQSRGHHLYGCTCSRKMIHGNLPASSDDAELLYRGTCRQSAVPLVDGNGWRVQLPDASVTFEDGWNGVRHSHQPQNQCGDLLIRDRHNNWTYNFAVTVDDFIDGVDLVVRGLDIQEATGRQIQIAEMLGRKNPATFVHHPLIVDDSGKKLSKRDGSTALSVKRKTGVTPESLIGSCGRILHPDHPQNSTLNQSLNFLATRFTIR
jgi:glutamyl-Q tRNA(Asp) synthetase